MIDRNAAAFPTARAEARPRTSDNTAELSREWTIADLAGRDRPNHDDLAEALTLHTGTDSAWPTPSTNNFPQTRTHFRRHPDLGGVSRSPAGAAFPLDDFAEPPEPQTQHLAAPANG
ncbi:hypothetical protein [Dactylosporangium sp. NPDC048998]|uniref:hypothetical protein n=1 Tax=Dactylosporangium sp. NPDC048998 TaxID=3363976 RepID=UPI00371C2D81